MNIEKDINESKTQNNKENISNNPTSSIETMEEFAHHEKQNIQNSNISNKISFKQKIKKITNLNNKHIKMTLLSIFGYFFSSIGVIYYNYWLFSRIAPFPVFVTWFQQIVGVICFTLHYLCTINATNDKNIEVKLKDIEKGTESFEETVDTKCNIDHHASLNNSNEMIQTRNKFSIKDYSSKLWKKTKDNINWDKIKNSKFFLVIPMSICFVGLVAFGNICLKYVQVSTYQVARSGSLIFTVVVSYFLLNEKQTWQSVMACIIVCIGFLIGSLDKTTLSILGIITGLVSSICQVFYNVFMKKCMNKVNGNATILLRYNQLIAAVLLVPCIFIAQELDTIHNSLLFDINSTGFYKIWILITISGLLAILLNYFSLLVVGYTSPVTFNVLGLFKSCAQTAGGFIIFKDHATIYAIVGIVMTLSGSVWYGFSKALNFTSKNNKEINLDNQKILNNIVVDHNSIQNIKLQNDCNIFEIEGDSDCCYTPNSQSTFRFNQDNVLSKPQMNTYIEEEVSEKKAVKEALLSNEVPKSIELSLNMAFEKIPLYTNEGLIHKDNAHILSTNFMAITSTNNK